MVPSPPIFTGESSNRFRTSARAAGESAISTPCLCVVLNSTASIPTSVRFLMMVGTSQSFALLYVTVPSFSGVRPAAGRGVCVDWTAASAGTAATVERKLRLFMGQSLPQEDGLREWVVGAGLQARPSRGLKT